MSTSSSRCEPELVGEAAAVAKLVNAARQREAARAEQEALTLPQERELEAAAHGFLQEDLLKGLQESGLTETQAQAALARYDKLVQVRLLEELAAKYRAQWAPQPCPWVGAFDDEARALRRSA